MEALILAALRGEATAAELALLETWRAQSPGNESVYQETVRVWELIGRPIADSAPPAAADLIARAGVRPLRSGPVASRIAPRWPRWVAALAAVAVLAVGLRLAIRPGPSLVANDFATGPGEQATMSLGDGTVVRLGPQSRLRIVATASTRRVSFQGRAFFAVAHDPTRPFEIETPAGEVRVLGTRFDLAVDEQDLRVAVVEGRVLLHARGRQTRVDRGEVGRVLRGVTVPAMPIAMDSSTAWLGTFFAFSSTPLRDAAREISSRSGITIEISDSSLADRSVSGYFDEPDPKVMIRVICAAVVAECGDQGGKIVVREP